LITINGVKKSSGLANLKIRIFDIEEKTNVVIVDDENFKYDFLIGLDMITKFKLCQDENLNITQKVDNKEKKTPEEIKSEASDTKKENKNIKKFLVNFNEHIKEGEFIVNMEHLTPYQRDKINRILETYKLVFAKDKYDVGSVKNYEARIDLLVDTYCSKRPYRCTMEDRKEIEDQISKLLEKNLIEESYSPFSAPVTLTLKKGENKRSRLCVDFRDLNKIIVPQA